MRVDLGVSGAQATGGGGTDTLTGIEDLVGSAFGDTLIGNAGDSDQTYIIMRGITQGVTRSQSFQVPSHNFSDDLSWTRGKHTLQFGGTISRFRNPRVSTLNSFSDGATNASWLDVSGFAGTGAAFDPSVSLQTSVTPL